MENVSYRSLLTSTVRRCRQRLGLEQAQLAKRMAGLGFPWHPPTVSNIETGKRRLAAEELLGLSLALEVPLSALVAPPHDMRLPIAVGDNLAVPADLVAVSAGQGRLEAWLEWVDDEPRWPSEARRAELQDELEAARDSEARAMAEYVELEAANAMGGKIAMARHSAEVWSTRASTLQHYLDLIDAGPPCATPPLLYMPSAHVPTDAAGDEEDSR